MRIFLLLLALIGALAGVGWWIATQVDRSFLVGVSAAVFLLAALFWPRRAPCTGLHCGGCRDHDH